MKITPVSINRNVNIIKNNNPKVTNPVQRGVQSTSYGAGNVFAGANISFGLFIKPKRKTNDELVYNQAEKLSNQEQTKNEQSPQIIIDKKGNTALHKANAKKMQIMAESTPEEFKQAMLIQDNDGNTPLHGAYLSVAEIMEQTAPEEFKQAMSIKNQDGLTLSDINLGLNHITFN